MWGSCCDVSGAKELVCITLEHDVYSFIFLYNTVVCVCGYYNFMYMYMKFWTVFECNTFFRHKFIVVKSACYLHVHLSIWFSVAPTAWISVKFYIGDSYENLSEKIQICLKWGKNIGHWHEDINMLLLVTSDCHKSTLLTKMVSGCSFFCPAAYIIVAPTGHIYVKFWYWGLI